MNALTDVVFRNATEQDVRFIVDLAYAEMDKYLSYAYNGSFNWAKWESELRETIYDQNHSTTIQQSSVINKYNKALILELNEENIGFLWFSYYSNEIIWIDSIILTKLFQGKGFGKQIMNHLISIFRNDFKYIDLGVQEDNIKAQEFYTKLGFYKIEDIAMSYYLTDRMRKDITD